MPVRAPSLIKNEDATVARVIDSAYDDVKIVADNIDDVVAVADGIDDGTFDDVTEVVTEPLKSNINAVGPVAAEVATVAGLETEIQAVVADPLKTAIETVGADPVKQAVLDAEGNANTAELSKWEAEAERLTADSYATQPTDEFVIIYTSNGDGTFTQATTTEYSAKHWRDKAQSITTAELTNFARYGVVTGLIVTKNVGDPTKFDVSDGEYYINDTLYTYGGSTGNSTNLVAGEGLLVVGFDVNGLVTKKTAFTDTELLTAVEVGALATQGGSTDILAVGESRFLVADSLARLATRMKNYQESCFDNTAAAISENAVPFHLDIASGTLIDAEADSKDVAAETSVGGVYITRSGGNYVNTLVNPIMIDPSQYDDGTDMQATATGKFLSMGVARSSRTGTVYVSASKGQYNSLSEALNSDFGVDEFVDIKGLDIMPIARVICRVGDAKIFHIEDVRNVIEKFKKSDILTDGVLNLSSFANGSIVETVTTNVISTGVDIAFTYEDTGNSHLTCQFDEKSYQLPNGLNLLTPGLATIPQENYVYAKLVNDAATTEVSTTGWPDYPHCPIAVVAVKDAATTQTEGPVAFQAWINHMTSADGNGHLDHINYWIRQQKATYSEGLDLTTSAIGAQVPTLPVQFAAGKILQLHEYNIDALDIAVDGAYVTNDNTNPYIVTNNLNLLVDSEGNSLSGRRYSLVLLLSANEDGGKMFVNLPSGSYTSNNTALDDLQSYTNYDIPTILKGKAIDAYRLTVRHRTGGGGSYEILQLDDLRQGVLPSSLDPDSFRTTAPTLSGASMVNENSTLVVTITNYDAAHTYQASTTSGTLNIVGNTIEITTGIVAEDELHTLTVTALEDGYLVSQETGFDFTVLSVPVQNDTDTYIDVENNDFTADIFPSVVGGVFGSLNADLLGSLGYDATTYEGNGSSQDIVIGEANPNKPELITNSTFDEDVSGWTSGTTSELLEDKARLKINTISTSTGDMRAYQNVTTEIGKAYAITFDYLENSDTSRVLQVQVDGSTISPSYGSDFGAKKLLFIATGTSHEIGFKHDSNAINKYVIIDNVSVKEAVTIASIDFTASGNGNDLWLDRSSFDIKNDVGTVQPSGTKVLDSYISVVHIKSTNNAISHVTIDGLRGADKVIFSDRTSIENTISLLNGFTSSGFTVNDPGGGGDNSLTNFNTAQYISYQKVYTHLKWGVTTPTGKKYVEAYNPDTKEGMILFEGSGVTGEEIPHSMGTALDFMVHKNLGPNTTNWIVKFDGSGNQLLGTNAAQTDLAGYNYESDDTKITLEYDNLYFNNNGSQEVIYYKAKSSTWDKLNYSGTGEPITIETPFRVARYKIKPINQTGDWTVGDNKRGPNELIFTNLDAAELTSSGFEFTDRSITIPAAYSQVDYNYLLLIEADSRRDSGGSYAPVSEAEYTSSLVAKVDGQGNWIGVQDTAYTVSKLGNVLDSADATDIVIEGEIQNGDKLYVGDSSNFDEITASGVEYYDPDSIDPFGDSSLSAKYQFDNSLEDLTSNHDIVGTGISYEGYGRDRAVKLDSATVLGLGSNPWDKTTNVFTIVNRLKWNDTSTIPFPTGFGRRSGAVAYNGQYWFRLFGGVFRAGRAQVGNYTAIDEVIKDGDYHEYATVCDGTDIKIYVDGQLVNTTTLTANDITALNSSSNFYGVGEEASGFTADGALDKLRYFYNKALTDDEVLEIYNEGDTKLAHNQAYTPTFACKQDNVDFEVTFDGGTSYTKLTKDTAEFEGTAPTKSFVPITYTGDGGSKDIVTGIESVDLTVASNGNGLWVDRLIDDTFTIRNDANVEQTSGNGKLIKSVSNIHIKSTSSGVLSHGVYDGLRGINRRIITDGTAAETNVFVEMTGFNVDGFTVDGSGSNISNQDGADYVAYQTLYTHYRFGQTNHSKKYFEVYNPVTGDGAILYEGSGVINHVIPHSIGRSLNFVMTKELGDTGNWRVRSDGMSDSKVMYLDLDSGETTDGGAFTYDENGVILPFAAGANTSNELHIIYYKATSKTQAIGMFTGTAASGNFVSTTDVDGNPKTPCRVTIKRVDSAGGWMVFDNQRPLGGTSTAEFIQFNDPALAGTSVSISMSFVDGGFVVGTTNSVVNADGGTYLYIAECDSDENGGGSITEELSIKENYLAETIEEEGQSLGFKITQKEKLTKTTSIYAGLTESGS